MSSDVVILSLLNDILNKARALLNRVGEFLERPTDVHYTSVPVWRPWRDF